MRFFLLDHFSRHPWGCVEALKPFLGPFFPRKLLINMLVTLIGENSASESILQLKKAKFKEEERVARAEQNLESVPESESEHSSMRTIIDLHQDHEDSLLNQSDSLLNQSDSLLNQSDC